MIFDHVEIYVPDRRKAAAWYQEVLNFKVVDRFAEWAKDGPLMISSDVGDQMIALFEGPGQGDAQVRGLRRLAFRVSGPEFIRFVTESGRWTNPPLGASSIQDHDLSISVYFTDPFGNPLEVTTYEHQSARAFVDSFRSRDT